VSVEARTVRPFVGIESFATVLDDVVVHFGNETCNANSSISLDLEPHEYQRRSVVVQWAPDEESFHSFKDALLEAADSMRVDRETLLLYVTASTPYLKRTEIVEHLSLAKLEQLDHKQLLTDGRRADSFRAGHHGCSLNAYVLLNENLDPAPLRPWRKGTWLAHARFGLATQIAKSMFRPTPLDDAKRNELGLYGKTVRYFHMGDHDPLVSYDDQPEKPVLYVDENLLAELSANASHPSSISTQLQLALDFMAAVIHDASRREELGTVSIEDLADSLLGRVLRVAAGPRDSDRERLLALVRSDPGKAVARAEHTVDIQKRMLQTLHGDGS